MAVDSFGIAAAMKRTFADLDGSTHGKSDTPPLAVTPAAPASAHRALLFVMYEWMYGGQGVVCGADVFDAVDDAARVIHAATFGSVVAELGLSRECLEADYDFYLIDAVWVHAGGGCVPRHWRVCRTPWHWCVRRAAEDPPDFRGSLRRVLHEECPGADSGAALGVVHWSGRGESVATGVGGAAAPTDGHGTTAGRGDEDTESAGRWLCIEFPRPRSREDEQRNVTADFESDVDSEDDREGVQWWDDTQWFALRVNGLTTVHDRWSGRDEPRCPPRLRLRMAWIAVVVTAVAVTETR